MKELFAICLSTHLDTADKKCKGASIKSYIRAVYINGLALIINCSCSTFQASGCAELSMDLFVQKFRHDGKKISHYVNYTSLKEVVSRTHRQYQKPTCRNLTTTFTVKECPGSHRKHQPSSEFLCLSFKITLQK